MNGKSLSVGAIGDEVSNLQRKLQAAGREIPASELERRFFGPATRAAVGDFQKAHGIDPTCAVCDKTAAKLAEPTGSLVSAAAGEHRRDTRAHSNGDKSPTSPSTESKSGETTPISLAGSFTGATKGSQPQPTGPSLPRPVTALVRGKNGNGATDRSQSFVVRGHVAGAQVGQVVCSYDRDFRSEELLGNSPISDLGEYEIRYTADQFRRAEKRTADLRVAVCDLEGRELVSSGIHFNAQSETTIDLIVEPGPDALSEYERYMADLGDVLESVLLPEIADEEPETKEKDLDFLAGETGIARQNIVFLMEAAALEDRTSRSDLDDRARPSLVKRPRAIPAAVFYGWFRLGVPLDLGQLLAFQIDKLLKVLRTAIAQRLVPASLSERIDDLRERIEELRLDHIIQAPAPGTTAKLGDLLATMPVPLNSDQERAIAAAVSKIRADDPRLAKRIGDISGINGRTFEVARTLRLGALTEGYLPLVRELQRDPALGVGTTVAESAINELIPFAGFDLADWKAILLRSQPNGEPIGAPTTTPGGDYEERLNNYAASLLEYVEKVLPTAVLASRLAKDSAADNPLKSVQVDLKTFFDNNQAFNFGTTPVKLYLKEGRDEKLAGVSDPEAVVEHLEKLGRIANITPRYPEMRALLADDLHSAYGIVQLGERRFTERYAEMAGGAAKALKVFRTAEHVHASALNIYMKHGARFNSPTPFVISGEPVGATGSSEGAFSYRSLLVGLSESTDATGSSERVFSNRSSRADLSESIDGTGSSARALSDRSVGADLSESTAATRASERAFPSQELQKLWHSITNPIASVAADWATLFGSIELCDCAHCESLYSPAAYFVDVLRFLDSRGTPFTPLDGLLSRRPDLEHIQLTCVNSTTPLPYVDLVNEILETAIVPRRFEVTGQLDSVLNDINAEIIPSGFRTGFVSNGYSLSDNASVRVDKTAVSKFGEWVILDKQWSFTIKPLASTSRSGETKRAKFEVFAWPQTTWTQDELRANPEHVHNPAYAVLRSALYPWTLPLNLAVEEVRVYLRHLGVPRHEIMAVFFRGRSSGVLSDKTVALEYLGLTREEADIISGATTHDSQPVQGGLTDRPWDFWGVAQNANDIVNPSAPTSPHVTGDWDEVLRRVAIFLQQSGITYKDLLELLGTYFINPLTSTGGSATRLISIVAIGTDPTTCNLGELELRVADPISGYNDEGVACYVFDSQAAGTIPLYRLWGTSNSDHFYTTSAFERDHAVAVDGYASEGIACYVFDSQIAGTAPLYRLRGTNNNDHFYTTSAFERDHAVAADGYVSEGIACYVFDSQTPDTIPLYRLWNVTTTDHFYTSSILERDNAIPNEREKFKEAVRRIHRFVRLWRKLGWTMRDLDQTITTFDLAISSDGFDGLLLRLSHVQRLRSNLDIPLESMLSWWSNIGTAAYIDQLADEQTEVISLYQRLFRDKTVIKPLDEAFTNDGVGLTGKISEHVPALVAALRITANDLSQLITGSAAILTNDSLDLANLSRLYRAVSLARSLKLSIQEYQTIVTISGRDPFAAMSAAGAQASISETEATLRFVERARFIRSSGWSLDELDYVLRNEFKALSAVAPAEADLAATLDEIRRELQSISADNIVREDPNDPKGLTTDPSGDLTRKKLALLNWDTGLIEQVVATLNGSVTYGATTTAFTTPPVLPNSTGTDSVALASRPSGYSIPFELSGAVTINPKFLFACDSAIPIESATTGIIATALDQKFRDNLVNLPANATVTTEVPDTSWTISDRYSVVKNEGVLGVSDLKNLELRASRFLSQPERNLLAASSADADIVDATGRLFTLQDQLLGQASYEEVIVSGQSVGRLRFNGAMTNIRKAVLDAVSTESSYRNAVQELYDAPRRFIARYTRTFSIPDFSTELAVLPSVTFPSTLNSKIYFDATANPARLHFIGVMTDEQRDALRTLSNDSLYLGAIDNLFEQAEADSPNSRTPELNDTFLTAPKPLTSADPNSDTALLFDEGSAPELRFLLVLRKLLPYLRTALSERVVVQKMAEMLELEARTANDLLTKWVNSPMQPTLRAITEFQSPSFAESNLNVPLTAAAFPDQFGTFAVLHKIALIVNKLRITSAQLSWLFAHGAGGGWLNLNALPVSPLTVSSTALFEGWQRLIDLFQLRSSLAFGELGLFDLFDLARDANSATLNSAKEAYLVRLGQYTSWAMDDLEALLGPRTDSQVNGDLGFTFPDDYTDERILLQLRECFKRMKRLGGSAKQVSAWGKTNQTPADELDSATSIKDAAKAKYSDKQWTSVAKPLKDPLRERQRLALVSYLLAHPDAAKGQVWRDVNELYEYFLVDVEMGPCMSTTRILQATNSAQLYLQRCLMNLEAGVALTAEEVKEWSQWRKQYRLWEANRKVLFYPENWIEPELRDDKSPFFQDLENELLQNDLTMDTAETAFLHYLEKLDQVARLEIIGMYRQQEAADAPLHPDPIDILHVFGRTYTVPRIYFHRRLEGGVWSAWEKVDLDIEGDHILPVEWNRRLHLFWPVFTEKSDPQTKAQRAANDDPTKYWEIKFAWSEYKNNGWSPKKLSKDYLRQDWHLDPLEPDLPLNVKQEPRDISFKTRTASGRLIIGCYGGKIIGGIESKEEVLPADPISTSFQGILTLLPQRDITRTRQTTYVKCHFLINGAIPDKTERQKIRMRIIDGNGTLQENDVQLNSQGVANSASGYKDEDLVIELASEGYQCVAQREEGSWGPGIPSLGLPSVEYVNSIIETVADAVADALEDGSLVNEVGDSLRSLLSSAMSVGGAAALLILVVTIPKTSATIGVVALNAVLRFWGRRYIIDLEPIPPPPPKTTTVITDNRELKRMQGLGEFALDDCNGNLMKLDLSSMSPAQLDPLPGAEIANMMFEEVPDNALSVGRDSRNASIQLLDVTPSIFRLLAPQQDAQFTYESPFFFQDSQRTYLVSLKDQFVFANHFHARACQLIKTLKRDGIPGLLRLSEQTVTDSGSTFLATYQPVPLYVPAIPHETLPQENVDFAHQGAYSLYNWELFFHIPFFIATRLSENQRFEEAQKWFHYVFDPTSTDSPDRRFQPGRERFWRVRPFYEEALRPIETLEALIKDAGKIDDQVAAWQANPFRPHVVARMRVVAYMKAVVMRYIDNLIAWGDQLFRQDTIEAINEATQLYVLAWQILGRRPEKIPSRAKPKTQTFRTLDDKTALTSLSNAAVEIENFLPPSAAPTPATGTQGGSLLMPFFCITANDKLLGYWDTVADRLFKIRHCMNIEGIERALPLFQPPIDPGLLVRAVAAGVDIASVLNDLNAAVPHYRFNVVQQKATELCNDVKALGAALLSALEKKDGEELASLRSGHEVELLKAIRETKKQQVEEANDTLAGLQRYQDVVTARQQYYLSRPFMNPCEEGHAMMVNASLIPMGVQLGLEVAAGVLHLIPETKTGAPTTMGVSYGGSNIASGVQAFGGAMGIAASVMNTMGSLSATIGGYHRRRDDWAHQADLATKELQQVEKQIAAAEIRVAIAEHELENHDLQIENAREVDEYLRERKFTNQELYSWMVGKISGIYFQGYQLAYDVAKRAERTFRYELGLRDSNFVQFGYWDSLKKGLLSGERLYHDLKRMDVAYLDQNKREYEITKHVSLNSIDPVSLLTLKEAGECFVNLPEALFDLDYPGHYLRRVKSVGITIPCVTGPYTGVNCTLTQLSSSIRHANTPLDGKYSRKGDEDTRFSDSFGAIQSIVTSSGQNDTGLFEANVRDERYLPFEGQGVISNWRIQLPTQFKSFDYDTIADVVLHFRYTAREGGELLGQLATAELAAAVDSLVQADGEQGLARLFSLRHEFPNEWYRFLNSSAGATGGQTLTLSLTKDRFPFLFQDRIAGIDSMELFVKLRPEFSDSYNESTIKLSLQAGTTSSNNPLRLSTWNELLQTEESPGGELGDWTLTAWLDIGAGLKGRIEPTAISDILLVCRYECS